MKINKHFFTGQQFFLVSIVYITVTLTMFSCDAVHSKAPAYPKSETPAIENITDISEITAEQLITHFKLDVYKPASEQQLKIPAHSRIKTAVHSEIYAEVVAYSDGLTNSKKGSITVQLSVPAKNQASADFVKEITITNIQNPYNDGLETLVNYEIDFSDALENNILLADFIPNIKKHYLKELHFYTYGGQLIDLLQENRHYRAEIAFEKTNTDKISLTVQYFALSYSFIKGTPEICTETNRSVRKGIIPEKSYFLPKDVFNHIVNSPQIIGTQTYPTDFASFFYGMSLEFPVAVENSFFNTDYIADYQSKYTGNDYKNIVVGIERLYANDVTGELSINYYVTTADNLPLDDNLSDFNGKSEHKTHTLSGFKRVDAAMLKELFNPRVVKTQNSTDGIFRILTKTENGDNPIFFRADDLSKNDRAWYILFNEKSISEEVFKTGGSGLALSKSTPIFIESCRVKKEGSSFTVIFEILSQSDTDETTVLFGVNAFE